ncbi:hypothetical protein CcrColossus_gp328 [Caulobacter phage CcrColossus]|uniref:Uncharacterized protein n=1 Tax=Caulobacter phage CcrColossus TaxID=1211640 RepID=K4JWB9_9CAUD|nr:hypothetical protein CcrColossus_gp328 [Caulobacter phage CcrColossus]AFU88198.1 hypothetical protein CcrColossus_gp328 [Caulobacter phage CcrColossus]
MPCNSEYMNPNAREIESKKVAGLIVYANLKLGETPDPEVVAISQTYYGAPQQCDYLTSILCSICRKMMDGERERVIYDAHDPKARELADWWERHQAHDKAREEQEAHSAQVKAMADAVGGVLSDDQKALLREAVKTGAL